MNYTDEQLKRALAKMFPEHITFEYERLFYVQGLLLIKEVLDTELLHLCWLVEKALSKEEWQKYFYAFACTIEPGSIWLGHATWQQRTIALAKVKGVEIV